MNTQELEKLLADTALDDFPTARHNANANLTAIAPLLAREVIELRAQVASLTAENEALQREVAGLRRDQSEIAARWTECGRMREDFPNGI